MKITEFATIIANSITSNFVQIFQFFFLKGNEPSQKTILKFLRGLGNFKGKRLKTVTKINIPETVQHLF